ncbi:oligosaccharide flippase family protein, partial [bacterium]|nr:oligosaccharide flippase family protein [bacterium]
GGLLHLGVVNAMNRDVPVFRGKGDTQRVYMIQSVSLGFLLISMAVTFTLLLIFSLTLNDRVFRTQIFILTLLLLIYQFYIYLQTCLQADIQFSKLSNQQLIYGSLLPLITIPLALTYGLSGFIAGQAFVTGLVIIFILRSWTFNLKPIFNRQETIRLIRVGMPIMLVGLLYAFLTTADRLVIAAFLDIKQLGFYTLAIMVLSIVTLIPMVVAQQFYPRMAETWGRTSSTIEVRKLAIRQALMATGITLPVPILIIIVATPFVIQFLPEYQPGILPMKIVAIGPIFLALSGGFANMLNTLDKQKYYLVIQFIALMINVSLNIVFIKLGFGIAGVGTGTCLSYLVYSILLIIVGYRVSTNMDKEIVPG